MISFHQPGSRDVGIVGDCEPHGGTVNRPALCRQCCLEPLPQFSVSELIDDLLKLCLRKSQSLFEEALANLPRVVDAPAVVANRSGNPVQALPHKGPFLREVHEEMPPPIAAHIEEVSWQVPTWLSAD